MLKGNNVNTSLLYFCFAMKKIATIFMLSLATGFITSCTQTESTHTKDVAIVSIESGNVSNAIKGSSPDVEKRKVKQPEKKKKQTYGDRIVVPKITFPNIFEALLRLY